MTRYLGITCGIYCVIYTSVVALHTVITNMSSTSEVKTSYSCDFFFFPSRLISSACQVKGHWLHDPGARHFHKPVLSFSVMRSGSEVELLG